MLPLLPIRMLPSRRRRQPNHEGSAMSHVAGTTVSSRYAAAGVDASLSCFRAAAVMPINVIPQYHADYFDAAFAAMPMLTPRCFLSPGAPRHSAIAAMLRHNSLRMRPTCCRYAAIRRQQRRRASAPRALPMPADAVLR